jgi:hypothetical protein
MKKLLLFIVFIGLASFANAQQPTFRRVFYDPSGGGVQAFALTKTFDHNYIIAGEMDYVGLLIKMDSAGNILWSTKIGSGMNTQFNTIITTNDSCFLMAGHVDGSIFLMKVNLGGSMRWSKNYATGNSDDCFSVQQTFDGGYILCGTSSSGSTTPGSTIIAVKLDTAGNITWEKNITCGNYENNANSIKQTPDSGYVLIGSMENKVGSTYFYGSCLIKLSPTGTISWAHEYNPVSSGSTNGNDVMVTPSGLICYLGTNNNFVAIMKTDFSGNIIWCKDYTNIYGLNGYGAESKLHGTTDSGYVFVSGNFQGNPGQFIKIDSAGNPIWLKSLSLSTSDVIESNDKRFIVIGNGPLIGVKLETNNPQIGIITTDSLGNSPSFCVYANAASANTYNLSLTSVSYTTTAVAAMAVLQPQITTVVLAEDTGCVAQSGGITEINGDKNELYIYPNPATANLTIETPQKSTIEIFNIQSQLIKTLAANEGKTNVDVSAFPNGVYLIKIITEKGIEVKKFIIAPR